MVAMHHATRLIATEAPEVRDPGRVRKTPFWAGRAATIARLMKSGMPLAMAEAWIDAWDESTHDLVDFRLAPDFWAMGYEFAVEEYRRGYRPR
jgi:hypothetical protein